MLSLEHELRLLLILLKLVNIRQKIEKKRIKIIRSLGVRQKLSPE